MKFRQIGLKVIDVERAAKFYSDLLGAEPLLLLKEPGFAFFDLDGVRLFLDVNAPTSAVYLEVDDVAQKLNELRASGVAITTEAHVVFPDPDGIFDRPGNEWLGFFEDTEGNQVGLMSRD